MRLSLSSSFLLLLLATIGTNPSLPPSLPASQLLFTQNTHTHTETESERRNKSWRANGMGNQIQGGREEGGR